ncbi:hypothetical protein HX109_15330 [Galbibacter sp. BG1]|uniref:hypothetical protein n=1 Tax=Galbibacter sp. BG1 TaxID=1170699 RepID=UPI0015BB3784|nr:hypothetical protein [Galbibacter sp. BG1]QLE02871.1 hypothetical protein HX109_15330 [Galbibacter sp. BG1]
MKLFLTILLALTICSCGSKKKVVERKKEKSIEVIEKDVQSSVKNDITSNAIIRKEGKRTIVEPIDETKPSSYNGVDFQNAKITQQDVKENLTTETSDKSQTDFIDNSSASTETETDDLNKNIDIDRSWNVFDWLWLFLAVAIVLFAVRLYVKKINPISWVKSIIQDFV